MRALGLFVAAILLTLGLAALLSYPVWTVLHPLAPAWPFAKIAERLWQLLMLAALVRVVYRLRLSRASDWGYGLPRAAFLRQAAAGLVLGALSMLPVTFALIGLGVRPLIDHLSVARWAALAATGLLSGLTVAVVEETFFRGLMQGAVVGELVRRGGGALLGIALVALLYAALHFPARESIAADAVGPGSGWTMLTGVLAKFADFRSIADAFLALTAVGGLLGLVRQHTGSIALGLGLHAGWVLVMRVTIGATGIDHTATAAAWVSRSDGFTGWLVLAWTLLITLGVVLARDRLGDRWRPVRGSPNPPSGGRAA